MTVLEHHQPSTRVLAPDLARGAMLLFIALANAANCAFAGQPGLDPAPHGLGRVVNFLMATFVDARAYPVFAIMFGYGLVQLSRRQSDRVLYRRNAWLVVFGLAHATLLYFGDFLGAYGIVGLVATLLLVRRSDKVHRIVLWLWGIQTVNAVILAVIGVLGWQGGTTGISNAPNPSLDAPSYWDSLLDRVAEWPVHTASVLPFIVIVWLGIWAARRRVLEEPSRHRRLLRRTAWVGLGISTVGAAPYALMSAGVVHASTGTVEAMARVHAITGEYGGAGYVALFGLLALRFGGRAPRILAPVVALGQRSLSGYLLQSVCWLVLFAPFALNLGGTWAALAAAVVVWTVSALAAHALSVRGQRGPAEVLLRKFAYR
ncbi:DUF418 domain-containing protein [Dactylosporangium sp. NPDC051541]|uniref:DUF418 domain-containing protein n=1 Tax=Dactylosporangium sp. NPDC051541 TaxID=3363977 RepID=UPI00379B213D